MNQKTDRPILIDFFALGCTGKTTHSKELFNYLTAKGFKVKVLSFALLSNDKRTRSTESQRSPIPTSFKSIILGCVFFKFAFKNTKTTNIFSLIKWSYRLLIYRNQIKSYNSSGLNFIILDPSLSSKLKKFYKFFDDDSFAKALSFLEKNNFLSDLAFFIEADIDVVMKRRLARGHRTKTRNDSATFAVQKAISALKKQGTSITFASVNYNHFSSLDNNIECIAEHCLKTLKC